MIKKPWCPRLPYQLLMLGINNGGDTEEDMVILMEVGSPNLDGELEE